MKTQISRNSHRPDKRYSGVYQQQGRMLTDADWNELVTLLNERITRALGDVVGGGIPLQGGTWFDPRNEEIGAGIAYAQGLAAEARALMTYGSQPDFPAAPGPVAAGDVIYVDTWERTVLPLEDASLKDPGLHGADTCTRTQVMFQVKRGPEGFHPFSYRNPRCGDGRLSLWLRHTDAGPEATRVPSNYLFRLEIHDVKGPADDPTEITFKWSSENAAEAHANNDQLPQDFKGSDWAYEFYNDTSERHLGVHLVTAPGFPVRGILASGYPVTPPDESSWPYVRRWDGWCVMARGEGIEWSLVEGWERGMPLTSVSGGPVRIGEARVAHRSFAVALQELNLSLHWTNFVVAGDFWQAPVREDDAAGQFVASNAPPVGILHHYVPLGTVQSTGGGAVFIDAPGVRLPSLSALASPQEGYSGSSFIGSSAIQGSLWNLPAGTLQAQLQGLLNHVNNSMGAFVHKASFQDAVVSKEGASIERGDGILVLRTAEVTPSFELRSNPTSYAMGHHVTGSFISFKAAFDGIQTSGQSVYIMSGSATAGTGYSSGGFGFYVDHDASGRRLLGVTYGSGGAAGQSAQLVSNLSDGFHSYKAIHRGNFIEFFMDGTLLGIVSVTGMEANTVDTYSVSLNGFSAQPAEVAIAMLTVGNPLA